MAEIMASFVGPAIEVVKWIGAPIKRQFNYLCCFTSNIATLKDEAEELKNVAGDLQGKVDRARDDVEIISREIEAWITKSEAINAEMDEILNEVPNVGSGCLKLKSRFSLSKRAKKTTDRMKELRGQCKFDVISHPRPPAATEAVPLGGTTYEFQSRKQIEEDIMTTLRNGDVNMIGIFGMGGLGKTTMAKMIMNIALKENVFQEVVMAVVSQPVDKLNIQIEIGGSLGLDLKDVTSEAEMVQKLHERLTASTKRILLVLDDVWETLELEELGIPRGSKGCTILLTSQNNDVLGAMDVEKIFGMKVLSQEDSWLLFRGRAGTCVDDTRLNSMAKEVVRECKGLPIALTTVGLALKDEKDVRIWEDALLQLTQPDPDIIDFIAKVYNPLKLSYDALGSMHAKSIFLLCCLFGEDADIRVEYLTYLCMGLGIFEGVSMEEARNRMCALTKRLENRSLLLEGRKENHVRMHDVVRDVCKFIAEKEGYIGHNDNTWISSFQTVGGRTKLSTNRRLLFVKGNSKLEKEIFDKSFVDGIRDLHVMFIKNYSFTSLPHTTESLENLNTLVLLNCSKLSTISVVGKFVNLEILVCLGCRSLEELPQEIKRLNRLKLLYISGCRNLRKIGGGIISSLVSLEELKMKRSFSKWEAWDGKGGDNAGLRELESLINLRCLEIEIDDLALVAENMPCFSSNLKRLQIGIPPPSSSSRGDEFSYSSNKRLSLRFEGGSCEGDWIEMKLLQDAECLCLTRNRAKHVDYLVNRETMKNIIRRYGVLEHLHLSSVPQLEIWDGSLSFNSFNNISSIVIYRCKGSTSLFSSSIAGNLVSLKELYIHECDEMIKVITDDEEKAVSGDGQSTLLFLKLWKLELRSLRKLVSFCEWECDVELLSLRKVEIEECPNMKYFTWGFLGAPKLETVKINEDDFDGVTDLNEALRQHYNFAQEKEKNKRKKMRKRRKESGSNRGGT